jgi:heptosyltransferase-1
MAERSGPRILLVRRSSLGDVVVSLPALAALRRGFPDAYLAWLVEDHLADLVRGHDCLDEVITIRRLPAREPRQWWQEARRVGRYLREQSFDLAVDLQGRGKSALMCYLSGAPRRIGYSNETHGPPGLRWINERVPTEPGLIAVARTLHMVNYLGAPIFPVEFRYPVLPGAAAWAQEFTAPPGGHLIALVLGASSPIKTWPPDHFAALAQRLRDEGSEVVLVGGPGEAEREALVQASLSPSAPSAVGRTSLPQLAALLNRVDAVVSGDTGALHVASALGTPVVGLYGPTSPLATGPYGPQHRVLWDQPPCGPCVRRPRCRDYHCMTDLTPERVAEAVQEVLAEAASRKSPFASGEKPARPGRQAQ